MYGKPLQVSRAPHWSAVKRDRAKLSGWVRTESARPVRQVIGVIASDGLEAWPSILDSLGAGLTCTETNDQTDDS